MTNYGTDNLVTHILPLIWSKNSNSQMYKVTFPKIRHFPEMVNFGRSFIDTIMGISRGDWKCPEDYITFGASRIQCGKIKMWGWIPPPSPGHTQIPLPEAGQG